MKALSAVLFLLVLCSYLSGAPLRNVSTEITQPDGSVISCFMTGDEYYHRLHDSNGFTIVQNSQTGWFVFAEKSGADLIPGSQIVGRSDPQSLGLTSGLMPDKTLIEQKVKVLRGENMSTFGRAPTIGAINNLCIFIRFSDQSEFGDQLSYYDGIYNSTTAASMKGYFLEESANQLTVETTFYPTQPGGIVLSYADTFPRAYYQPQSVINPIGFPPGPAFDPSMYGYQRLHTLFTNAVAHIGGMVPPWLNIDADNNGSVDNISFICRGQADGTGILWPHYWVMDAYPSTPLVYIHGKKADDYNFEPQQPDPVYGGGVDTAVICHEFSHTLGFPDLYHYSFDGLDPCGYWDLQDWCYQIPQHHLAYQKWKYGGWFTTVPTLPASGTCTLDAVVYNPFDCYMYQLPTGEQIWLEYRRSVGTYESRVPGSGLLIYRVDQSLYPWGNAGGPPDEIYVYRPFVNPGNPNGNLSWAHYAWEQSHTAMNQFTDPAPFSQSSPGFIGGLNIYSVGSSLGQSITFEVGAQVPVIWTGAMDNNWFNGANWTTGTAPSATDLAIVAQGAWTCTITPLPGPGAQCSDLRVENQLNLFPGAVLQVGNNLDSIGRIFMDGNALQVGNNLSIRQWYAGSWFHCNGNPAGQTRVGGDCLFEANTNVQFLTGMLIFINPGTNTFRQETLAVFNDISVQKTGGVLNYESAMISAAPLQMGGSFSVGINSVLNLNADHDFALAGSINVDPSGQFNANAGTIHLTGMGGPQTINIANPGSYLNNLKVNIPTGLVANLAANMTVRGMLSFSQGSLAANTHSIFLHGEWSDMVGPGAFQKGMSRVVFCGTTDQHILLGGGLVTHADFYTLELAKPSGDLHLNMPGIMVTCDQYDYSSGTLRVSDGLFVAGLLLDNCIAGNIICTAPGMINLTNMAGPVDLNADLTISGGSVNIYSGPGNSQWPGPVPALNVNPGLHMDGGMLVLHNTGVFVGNPAMPFTENISGGIIQVNGDFEIHRGDFNPAGGIVEIVGSNPANLATMPGSGFFDLTLSAPIQQSTTPLQINGMLNVSPGSIFHVMNDLNVQGHLQLLGTILIPSPVIVTIMGGISSLAGSMLDFMDGMILVAGFSPMTPVDGNIQIENGILDIRDHTLQIGSTGSISFGTYGGGANGRLICAGLTALHSGTFIPSTGALELAGSQPGTDYSLSLDNGNHAWDLVINTQENVLLGCDLNVENDLIHQQGVLDVTTNQYQIWIKGDWLSSVTSDPFMERNGTVHMLGSASSVVNWGAATAGIYQLNVEKDSGASLTQQSITQVGGMLNVMSNATLNVYQNLSVSQMTILEGQMHLANPITAIFTGALNCMPGSQLYVNDATCTLSGSTGLFMDGTMSLNGGLFDAKNRNLNIGSGGAIVFSGNGRIKCANFYADHSGNFTPSSGTLELGSTTTGINRNLRLGSGNYVHNLVINSAGQVNTLSSLPCHNDLQIMSGRVLNLAYDATVDGDLDIYGTCNLSPSVTLLLHGHPTIASGGILNVNAGTFICDETPSREALSLDGTIQISSGIFELEKHYLNISSTGLILQSGGTLKLNGLSTSHNGRYQPVGGSLELTQNLSATQRELALPGDNYCFDLVIDTNATIMLGADLEIKGDLDILAGYLDASANDYDIDLYGSWINSTGDGVTGGFVCRAGSVRFIGSTNSDISYQGDRELFHTLIIDKTNATNIVKLLCPAATTTGGSAGVSKGIFSLNGFELENSGSTDVLNGGTLLLEPGSTLATGADHILNIYSGGTLITRGSGRARSALKGKDAQPWKARAHGGSYVRTGATDYQDLKETGFWVEANATVDPDSCFNHCSFSAGASGCTYLTFDNDQILVIGYASFSGNGSQLYNIAKSSATGSITLNDATGNFAGPAHEYDPHSRIFWSGYLPNLTISSIVVSETDPYVADQISYTVYILNDSDNPSEGNFNVHLFKHRAGAPDLDELSDLYQSLGNIAANGTANCTFANIYNMDAANWTSWVSIDPEGAITETDEEDNLDDCSVIWHALPAVTDAEISATGSNTARLQWSFPIWCDRYKIWWDADPYGSFENYLGSATQSFFDLTLSTDRRFYRMVAERDVPTP